MNTEELTPAIRQARWRKEENDEPSTRLWADDENAKTLILSIDLSVYDELATYPVEVDWPHERRKLIFL